MFSHYKSILVSQEQEQEQAQEQEQEQPIHNNLFITTLIYLPFAICRWFSSNAIKSRLLNITQISLNIVFLFWARCNSTKLYAPISSCTPQTQYTQYKWFAINIISSKGKNFNSWYPELECFFKPFWLLNSIYQPYMP